MVEVNDVLEVKIIDSLKAEECKYIVCYGSVIVSPQFDTLQEAYEYIGKKHNEELGQAIIDACFEELQGFLG